MGQGKCSSTRQRCHTPRQRNARHLNNYSTTVVCVLVQYHSMKIAIGCAWGSGSWVTATPTTKIAVLAPAIKKRQQGFRQNISASTNSSKPRQTGLSCRKATTAVGDVIHEDTPRKFPRASFGPRSQRCSPWCKECFGPLSEMPCN